MRGACRARCFSARCAIRGRRSAGLSRKHVIEACHQALQRLRVDYLDLYFCHRPDPDTPIEETVAAMDMLVRQGKVLYWGTSEWPADAIRTAHRIARANHLYAPQMEQPQYNLFHRERVEVEYAPLYDELGLGTTTWSPLASGLLTGKYNDGIPAGLAPGYAGLRMAAAQACSKATGRRASPRCKRSPPIARELGVPLAQLAIAWCLQESARFDGDARRDEGRAARGESRRARCVAKLGDADVARIEAAVA